MPVSVRLYSLASCRDGGGLTRLGLRANYPLASEFWLDEGLGRCSPITKPIRLRRRTRHWKTADG
jgi:hypothetical protein